MDTQVIFKNSASTICITNDHIIYNNIRHDISNSHYLYDYTGRIQTAKFNLKWNKDDLFIYENPSKIFVEELKRIDEDQVKNVDKLNTNASFSIKSLSEPEPQNAIETATLFSPIYFQVTGERMLKFESFKNKSYILTDIYTNQIFQMVEFVSSKSVFQYKSQDGFILFIDNKNKKYRWKNIPIGKF